MPPRHFICSTGLFEGIFEDAREWRWLHRLIFPMLQPSHVASHILQAVARWRDSLVVIPYFLDWVNAILGLFPIAVLDWVCAISGGIHGMSHYRGHGMAAVAPPSPPQSSGASTKPTSAKKEASPVIHLAEEMAKVNARRRRPSHVSKR